MKWILLVIAALVIIGSCSTGNHSSSRYDYDPNHDGHVTTGEFQGAVGNYLDDHGY